jgi:septum formation protein
MRLSTEKAYEIAKSQENALIIGSDQIAIANGVVLGKPGTRENALKQLSAMRGQSIQFLTGLALLNSVTESIQVDCVTVDVHFRAYSDAELNRYLDKEPAYDCAGSFKSEGLGITLVDSIRSEDPSALIGLPLVRLTQMLRIEGLELP